MPSLEPVTLVTTSHIKVRSQTGANLIVLLFGLVLTLTTLFSFFASALVHEHRKPASDLARRVLGCPLPGRPPAVRDER